MRNSVYPTPKRSHWRQRVALPIMRSERLRNAVAKGAAVLLALQLPAWATPLAVASLALLLVQSLDHRFAWGSTPLAVALFASVVLLFLALYQALAHTDNRLLAARRRPFTVLLVCVLAINTLIHVVLVLPHLMQPNRYSTDAAAATDCATQLFLHGHDPYGNLHMLTCMHNHGLGFFQTTPKRDGTFHNMVTYPNPKSALFPYLMWRDYGKELRKELNNPHYISPEFEERFNYPGGAIFTAMLALVFGFRDLVPLYLGCAILASWLIYRRTRPRIRWIVGLLLLGDTTLLLDEVGGVTDILYGFILVVYWALRDRPLLAGLLLGLAAATRQQVWFFLPFLLYLGWRVRGRRDLRQRGLSALAIFLLCNAPFLWMNPGNWFAGVLGPMRDPLFAQGVGLINLSIVGLLPLVHPIWYGLLECVVWVGAFRFFTRHALNAPGLALLLPLLPLVFAWRSLHTYFIVLPLLATAVLAFSHQHVSDHIESDLPGEAAMEQAA